MNILRDFKYLREPILRTEPLPVIIRNVYQRLKELNEAQTQDNITKVLKNFHYATTQVPEVLERLKRQDGTLVEVKRVQLADIQAKFAVKSTKPINGFAVAKRLVVGKDIRQDLEAIIDGIDEHNMFRQHSQEYVRYDVQDPGRDFSNLQIQVGGTKLKTSGKSSVTAVLISDEITMLCKDSATIRRHVATIMKKQHGASWQTGKQVEITLTK